MESSWIYSHKISGKQEYYQFFIVNKKKYIFYYYSKKMPAFWRFSFMSFSPILCSTEFFAAKSSSNDDLHFRIKCDFFKSFVRTYGTIHNQIVSISMLMLVNNAFCCCFSFVCKQCCLLDNSIAAIPIGRPTNCVYLWLLLRYRS